MKLIEGANRVNRFLEQAMPLLPPLGFVLGLLLPQVFLVLRPYAAWLFGTMTLAGALRLRVRELGRAASTPRPFLLYLFTSRIFMPLAILLLSSLAFRDDPHTISGYVLLFSVPTAVSSFVWVSIYRGDLALSLALILLDTALAPLVVPGTVRLLLGTSINLDMTGMALSLVYMVVIPTIVGVVLNESSRGKIPDLICPWLSPLSKLCMVLVIAANSAAVGPQIHPDNLRIWVIAVICIFFTVLGFVCGMIMGVFGKLDREKQITLFLAAGMKNNSAAMVLGIQFFPASAAIPAVLGIMTQHIIAGTIGRIITKKIRRSAPV
jgi:predicted Na+-dependent transporter